MALLFCDSFDHYATADIMRKWTWYFQPCASNNYPQPGGQGAHYIGAYGRRSSNGYRVYSQGGGAVTNSSPTIGVNVPASGTTGILGFAWQQGQGTLALAAPNTSTTWYQASTVWCVRSRGAIQLWGRFTSTGQMQIYSGDAAGTLLVTSTKVVAVGVWYYFEIKWVIGSGTSGSVEVRQNGYTTPLFCSATGVNTDRAGTGSWNEVMLGRIQVYNSGGYGGDCSYYYDDLYILDSTGTRCNDYMGDCRIDCVFPTSDGSNSDWTCSTGSSHYQLVDESTPNTSDYNSTTTLNAKDTLNFPDSPIPGTIGALQLNYYATRLDGVVGIKPVTRIGGTDNLGSEFFLANNYKFDRVIQTVKPGSSSPWTDTDFNAAEFGYVKST